MVTALLPEYAIDGGAAARTETVQRTLFNPTRRPAPTLAADKAPGRMQRGQFALDRHADRRRQQHRLPEGDGVAASQRRVKQGEQVNGMTVAEVKPDRVRLALGDEAEEIALKVATNPRPTPPAVASSTDGPAGAPMPVPMPAAAAPAAAPRDANPSSSRVAAPRLAPRGRRRRLDARGAVHARPDRAAPAAAAPRIPRGPDTRQGATSNAAAPRRRRQ